MRNTQKYIVGAQKYNAKPKKAEAPVKQEDPEFFSPRVKKGEKKVFLLRFVPPSPKDDEALVPGWYVYKTVHFIGEEVREPGESKDLKLCRKNLGKKERCPLCDYRFSPQGKDDKRITWSERYLANVLILKAPEEHKDLIGKVLTMEFGNQVFKIIKQQTEPEPDEINENPVAYDILNGKTGKNFIYKMDYTGPFQSYKDSYFESNGSSLGDDKRIEEVFEMAPMLQKRLPKPEEILTLEDMNAYLAKFLGDPGVVASQNVSKEKNFETKNQGVSRVLDSIPDATPDSVSEKPTDDWYQK